MSNSEDEEMGDLQSSSIMWGCQVAAACADLNVQISRMEDARGLSRSDPAEGFDKRLERLDRALRGEPVR
jgi:hypothetical protein